MATDDSNNNAVSLDEHEHRTHCSHTQHGESVRCALCVNFYLALMEHYGVSNVACEFDRRNLQFIYSLRPTIGKDEEDESKEAGEEEQETRRKKSEGSLRTSDSGYEDHSYEDMMSICSDKTPTIDEVTSAFTKLHSGFSG